MIDIFVTQKMGWGFWKKLKNGVKKAFNWVKDKIVKPVFNTAKNLLPAIGAAVAPVVGAPPQAGMAVGSIVKGVGDKVLNG